jgi:hypothetical protein
MREMRALIPAAPDDLLEAAMRFLFLLLAGFLVFGCNYQATAEEAVTTQYWDACKPSCSWRANAPPDKQASACFIAGGRMDKNNNSKSACDKDAPGPAFACMNQAPFKVGNRSYGYAAINMGSCGDCYELTFPNKQVMVVMKNNIGALHEGAKFDLMIPGGGVGDFNALTRQVETEGHVSNPDMGERYGGFRGKCGWKISGVDCVRKLCNEVFENLPYLRNGCLWYPDTLGTDDASFDNPIVTYRKVACPTELKNRY